MPSEYQHIYNSDAVLRYVDQATIPPEPANFDWQRYQQYVAEGGTTDPAPVPPDPGPPPPDPNVRLDNGVDGAVDAWNTNTPQIEPAGGSGGLSVEERLLRLEESLKAMCNGHMADTTTPPVFG
jgi:hypothetical protein